VQQIIALSFEKFTRDAVRRAAWGMMMEEVEALCGPRYRPTWGSAHRRAGTKKGVLRHGARREAIAAGKGEVALDKELCAIVALGIEAQGDKQVLDFKVGTSESAEYATRLLRRLVERGFEPKAKHRLLSVTTACTQACW